MLRIIKFIKDVLLAVPITLLAQPFSRLFAFLFYYNKLIIWIWKAKSQLEYHDFYSLFRNYNKRYDLFRYILEKRNLSNKQVVYLEFGVASGASFRWWLSQNENLNSHFFGFDTFKGLPEKWGGFDKGSMSYTIPEIKDSRALFIPGLFQNTMTEFISKHNHILQSGTIRILHMDADLYSATIFTLSQLWPFLKKGDLIFFDEFSVAMHEFKAYIEFVNNFYIKLRPVAAVNNFYQICFVVD